MHIQDLERKKIGIWGLGREGISILNILMESFPDIDISILNDFALTQDELAKLSCYPKPFPLIVGKQAVASHLISFEVIIKSPGISPYRPEVNHAKNAGVLFISPTQLWYNEFQNQKIVCITGTKGKSTTTNLIAQMLKSLNLDVAMGGNIGIPLMDLAKENPSPDIWVIEMSSYQAHDFTGDPSICVLLNLYPEHFDWHGNKANYFRDKLSLFSHLKKGISIINGNDPIIKTFKKKWNKPLFFDVKDSFYIKDNAILYRSKKLIQADKIKLKGQHNLRNICAALTVLKALNIEVNDSCLKAISEFEPLTHRLTVLGSKNGVVFVDDSISTTPESTIAAIRSFNDYKFITLLVGGYDRGLDYSKLIKFILSGNVFSVITMPKTGWRIAEKLAKSLKNKKLYNWREAENLEDAVKTAVDITPSGGIILLSPGAPSYGEFKNFEERGKAFARYAGF